MKAINIIWDTDGEDVMLPAEIEIPKGMTDEDEISDYLSDVTGFCHQGFALVYTAMTKDELKELSTEILQEMAEAAFSDYYAEATKPCGNWQPGMKFPELDEATKRLNAINDELERRMVDTSDTKVPQTAPSLEDQIQSAEIKGTKPHEMSVETMEKDLER